MTTAQSIHTILASVSVSLLVVALILRGLIIRPTKAPQRRSRPPNKISEQPIPKWAGPPGQKSTPL